MYCICILFIILVLFSLYSKHNQQKKYLTNKKHKEYFIGENDINKVITNKTNLDNDNDIPKLPPLPDYNALQAKMIKQNKPIIQKRTIVRSISNKCRFIPSHKDNKCDDPVYTKFSGASLGIGAKSIQCNGKKIMTSQAKAISLIKNGKIDRIQLTKKGNYYKKEPKIKIQGNAVARAVVKKGRLEKILLVNKGSGYKSSPQITIDPPNYFSYCNLCCSI